MSVQIVSDNKVIFEFESPGEVQTLINIICHAKFGDGMRWEYTLSPTATRLISALADHLQKTHSDKGPYAYLYKGKDPIEFRDGGQLQKKVEKRVVESGIESSDPNWKDIVSEGMYPWKAHFDD